MSVRRVGFQFNITVDGERFAVSTSMREGHYGADYAWVTGKNPGYGFGESLPYDRPPTQAEAEHSIRVFLAQVDPETGYIED